VVAGVFACTSGEDAEDLGEQAATGTEADIATKG